MNDKKQFIGLDYLRAFCMLYVVGYWHVFNYTSAFPGYANAVTGLTAETVLGLFTLVSGFLIGMSYNRAAGALTFYRKRLIRIYPLYALAIVIFYLLGISDTATSMKAALFVSMYYGPAPTTLWFITMLMLFYLITPLLIRVVESPLMILLAIVIVFAISIAVHFLFNSADIRVLYYFPCYIVGLYCARHGIKTAVVNPISALLLLGLWLLLLLPDIHSWVFNGLSNAPKVLGFAYLIFFATYSLEGKFRRFVVVSMLSYSSYAMYLFHRPIYQTLKATYFPESGAYQVLYLMVFALFVVFVVSWGVQRLYDAAYAKLSA